MSKRSLFRRQGTAWLAATVLAAAAVVAVAGPPAAVGQPGSSGTKQNPDEKGAAASAAKLVQQESGDLKVSDRDEFTRHKVITTNDGLQYVPYTRTYQGLPVVGGDFVVVTDANGKIRSTSVQQQQEIEIGTSPKLTKSQAAAIAKKLLDKVDSVESNKLVVHAIDGTRLAYEVELRGTKKKLPHPLRAYVDALNGEVLRTQKLFADGTGTGKWNGPNPLTIGTSGTAGNYKMQDTTRGNNRCGGNYQQKDVFTDSDDNWGNGVGTDKVTGCVDTMFGLAKEWDMLQEWLGRNGIDGSGNSFPVYMGDPYGQNAHWWYGQGYSTIGYNSKNEWLSSLDVVAHEFGHGLDEHTPGGISADEVAEFTADVFGATTEAYANEPSPYDTPDYLVGETINLNGSGPIRNMYDPSKVNGDPNCYSSSVPTMETHKAAGPGNHWFYLLAEGSNPTNGMPASPTCNNTTLTGIGVKQAAKIFYNAMLRKTSSMTYLKYRTATLAAAKDLDPTCTQFNKVKAAWDAVSVPAQTADPTCSGTGDTQAPTAPGNLRSTGKTSTSVSLAWDASTDNVGVDGYDVYNGSIKATTVTGTSATVSGLTGGTNYTFTVNARDAAGNTSPASNALSVTTDPGGGGTAPDISVDNVKAHLQQLQTIASNNNNRRSSGTNGYYQSVGYIAGKLRDAGYTVTEQACTSGCTGQDKNVIAEWKGGDENAVYLLGGHLDSVTSGPGINDNGSGSALLLEVALKLAEQNPVMAKRIRFGWWAAEETGLNGSKFYTNLLSTTERSKIKGYLNFDMNGSPNPGYFVDNLSTELAKSLTGYFDSISVPTEEMTECCSDDGSFRNIGVPTTFLSAGAGATKSSAQAQKWGGTAGEAFDKCYHQACDKYPDNIHTTALDRNADAAAYALWKLAVQAGGNQPPSTPVNLRSTGKTSTSVSLAWDASTDDQGVTGYDVYDGTNLATTVTGTSATVSGLTAGTAYTFTVKAKDAAGATSPASDPVTVTTDGGPAGGLANGGFEAGTLSSWTTGGTAKAASTVSSGAHGGTYAARLGSTTETNGESTLSQTFTVPAGSSSLSFWYSMTCPDTVTYAWAKATLTDNTAGATTTPLAKTCTNGQGWKQATAPVTAGNSYTLTLVNRDDNHPDDPVYTLFDDVSAGPADPGGNEFSLSASPAALTVQKGQSGSSTISTAVTSGNAQTVQLSAAGLPAGASATFAPSSVTAGDSSKLTISTTSTTPDGTSTVTITGDGADVDRSTTLSLTVGGGDPGGALKQISKDIYTNTDSQHATQVEPDAASWGTTVVSAFQTGRYQNGGASNLAWSTSTDGGQTWTSGNMSGVTKHEGNGPHDRTTDPVVAYSAKHSTWLIGTTPLNESGSSWTGQGMKVIRSSDGLTWGSPIVAVPAVSGKNFDKNSIGCDNNSTSPNYGTCYVAIDDYASSNQLWVASSTDGGQTWSAPKAPSGATGALPNGIVTLPDGTAVIGYGRVIGGNDNMVITSKDGGATWSQPSLAAHIKWHQPNGGLRGNPMITMDTDGAGKIYLAWASCEFRTDTCSDSSNSSRNDIIYVTSTDAKTWSSPVRIPIDVSNASMERYFPELGVDKSTSGSNAKLGLHYYFYDNGGCSSATDCQLKVGYVSSANGGTSWSAPQTLAGPFPLTQIANTSSGRMIGDYIGGAMVNGKAVGVFPVGQAPADGKAFDQATYTFGPLAVTGGTVSSSPLAAKSPAAAADRQKMLQKRTG